MVIQMFAINFLLCLIEMITLLFFLNFNIGYKKTFNLIVMFFVSLICTFLSQSSNVLLSSIFLMIIYLATLKMLNIDYNVKNIYKLIFFYFCSGFISIFVSNIFEIISSGSLFQFSHNPILYLIGGLINKIIMFVIVYIMNEINLDFEFYQSKNISLFIISSFSLFFAFLQHYLVLSSTSINQKYFSMMSTLLVLVFYFFCFILLIKLFSQEKKHQELSTRLFMQKIYTSYEFTIQQSKNEIKKINHDIKKQLFSIDSLLENKEFDKAKAFIKESINRVNTKSPKIWSKNIVLDSIIFMFINENSNIQFDININSNLDHIEEIDCCILFYNLIENAVEAATKSFQKSVKIVISEDYNFYLIDISNSIENNEINLKKTKKTLSDNHGFGVVNIYDTLRKLGGDCAYTSNNYWFTINILIPVKDKFI